MGTPAKFWPVVAADVIKENSNHDFKPLLFRGREDFKSMTFLLSNIQP